MRYVKILLLAISFYVVSLHAQELEFQHFSTRQGLSQSNVWDIHQDKFGFIWVATEDGLNVFDGYSFKVYRNDPSDSTTISNSNIRRITQDANGNLWVGTRYGLNFYDRS